VRGARWLLLPLLSLGAWGAGAWQRARAPTPEDWRAAVEALRPLLAPGDAVTWLPEWAGEGRVALRALGATPEERARRVWYAPHEGELDLGRARRVWVIGAFGRSGRDLAGEGPRRADGLEPRQPLRVGARLDLGRLDLTALDVGGARVAAGLYEDLSDPARVEVWREGRGAARRCALWGLGGWHCAARGLDAAGEARAQEALDRCLARPRAERLRARSRRPELYTLDRRRHLPYVDCGLPPAEHVSRDVRVIGGDPRRCVWAHPARGEEVVVRWRPRVGGGAGAGGALPAGAALWLRWGWEDLAADPPYRASGARPLRVTLAPLSAPPSRPSPIWEAARLAPAAAWRGAEVPLDALAPEARAALARGVELRVSAPEGAADAHLCVDLTLRAPESAPGPSRAP